jgi:uncharacterized membrane protein (DUF373 family)
MRLPAPTTFHGQFGFLALQVLTILEEYDEQNAPDSLMHMVLFLLVVSGLYRSLTSSMQSRYDAVVRALTG